MIPILVALAILLAFPSLGSSADFFIRFNACRITIGYLVLSNESLKTVDGDGSITACTRSSQDVRCEFQFGSGATATRSSDIYQIIVDTPPLLIFSNPNTTDYYVIDQIQHAATLITRVMDARFAGAKVCHGMYMTETERRELEKPRQK